MTALRIPLRAGQRAGWRVVTWAPASEASVHAIAQTDAQTSGLAVASAALAAVAQSDLQPLVARVASASEIAVARTELRPLRGVTGRARILSMAEVSLAAQVWAPIQPDDRVTYRRYSRADYHQMLMDLLPRGRAWPRDGEDADLMAGWAAEFARVEQRGWDLLDEVDPRTTKELMPDWEHFFELPGTASEDQRRKELIAEWLAGGSLSRDNLEDLLKVLGIKASVYYWRPFRCGVSACGDYLATDWFSTVTITVYEPKNLDLAWLQEYLRKLASGGDWVHVVAGY